MLNKIKNVLGTIVSWLFFIVILASQVSLLIALSAGMDWLGENIRAYPWLMVILILAMIGIALDYLYLEEHVR